MRSTLLFLLLAASALAQNPVARAVRCVDAGSTDAYTCSPTPALSAYSALTPSTGPKVIVQFVAGTSNLGPANLAISGLAPQPLVKYVGAAAAALVDNDIRAGGEYLLIYDPGGSRFVVVSVLGSGGGGGGASTMTFVHTFAGSGSTGSSTTNYPLWMLPTATATSPSFTRIGASPDQMIVMTFDEADGTNTATTMFSLHPSYASGGTARVLWSSSAISTNGVRWRARQACSAVGTTRPDMATWNTETVQEVPVSGVANQLQATEFTMDMTNCAAGGLVVFQIIRDASHANDPSSTDIPTYSISYRYTINIP